GTGISAGCQEWRYTPFSSRRTTHRSQWKNSGYSPDSGKRRYSKQRSPGWGSQGSQVNQTLLRDRGRSGSKTNQGRHVPNRIRYRGRQVDGGKRFQSWRTRKFGKPEWGRLF